MKEKRYRVKLLLRAATRAFRSVLKDHPKFTKKIKQKRDYRVFTENRNKMTNCTLIAFWGAWNMGLVARTGRGKPILQFVGRERDMLGARRLLKEKRVPKRVRNWLKSVGRETQWVPLLQKF